MGTLQVTYELVTPMNSPLQSSNELICVVVGDLKATEHKQVTGRGWGWGRR